jgi:hypothetical protein
LGLEEALRRLRYVPRYPLPGSEVRSEDHNSLVDALKALSAECRARMPGDPLVDALDAAIAKIRYLRTGDIYEPEDHNYIVDALKASRDVLAKMESYYAARLDEALAELERLRVLAARLITPPAFGADMGLLSPNMMVAAFVWQVISRPLPEAIPPPASILVMGAVGSAGAEAVLYGEVAFYAG